MNEELNEVTQNNETTEQERPKAASESWNETREVLSTLKDENYHLRKQNELFMERLNSQLPPQEKKEEFDINQLADDDLSENRHLKATYKQQDQRLSKQDLKVAQLEEKVLLADMRDKYPDFKTVADPRTPEGKRNIKKLQELDPAFTETVLMNPDQAKQYDLIYNAIKRLGIVAVTPPSESDQLARYNTNTPKSTSALKSSQSRSALGQAGAWSGRMTEEMKADQFRVATERAEKVEY